MFLELSEKSAERLFRRAKRTIKLECKKGSDCFFVFCKVIFASQKRKIYAVHLACFSSSLLMMIMLVMIRANISTLLTDSLYM